MALNEEIRELDAFDIHKLSHAIHQELVDQNLIDENAFYLITDDEGFDTELNDTSENAPQTKVVYEALQNLQGYKIYKDYAELGLTAGEDTDLASVDALMIPNSVAMFGCQSVTKDSTIIKTVMNGYNCQIIAIKMQLTDSILKTIFFASNGSTLYTAAFRTGGYGGSITTTNWTQYYGSNDTIPVEDGGTGATDAETARTNLGAAPAYTYGTTDLTAGTSTLAAGTLYFVYEE